MQYDEINIYLSTLSVSQALKMMQVDHDAQTNSISGLQTPEQNIIVHAHWSMVNKFHKLITISW